MRPAAKLAVPPGLAGKALARFKRAAPLCFGDCGGGPLGGGVPEAGPPGETGGPLGSGELGGGAPRGGPLEAVLASSPRLASTPTAASFGAADGEREAAFADVDADEAGGGVCGKWCSNCRGALEPGDTASISATGRTALGGAPSGIAVGRDIAVRGGVSSGGLLVGSRPSSACPGPGGGGGNIDGGGGLSDGTGGRRGAGA